MDIKKNVLQNYLGVNTQERRGEQHKGRNWTSCNVWSDVEPDEHLGVVHRPSPS